jgi:hypothetical protein
MEGPLKELGKLEKLTAGKGKEGSIQGSLDSLLSALNDAKDQVESSGVSVDLMRQLERTVESKRKEVDDRQKEIYSSTARLGKALDKVRIPLLLTLVHF